MLKLTGQILFSSSLNFHLPFIFCLLVLSGPCSSLLSSPSLHLLYSSSFSSPVFSSSSLCLFSHLVSSVFSSSSFFRFASSSLPISPFTSSLAPQEISPVMSHSGWSSRTVLMPRRWQCHIASTLVMANWMDLLAWATSSTCFSPQGHTGL